MLLGKDNQPKMQMRQPRAFAFGRLIAGGIIRRYYWEVSFI